MYTVFLGIQHMGIVVLLAEAMYIIRQKPSRQQITLLVVVLATLINFVGYMFEIQCTEKQMALLAVKFLYLGKPYIILATFLFAMDVYRIRISGIVRNLLCGIHVLVSMLVFTCDRHHLFYSSIDYTTEGSFPHLVLGYSPLYKAYSGLVVMYLALLIGFGIYRYTHSTSKKEQKQIIYMLSVTCVAGGGFVLYFSGVMKGYDCTLPAYLICAVLLLIAMLKYDLLDAVSLVKENVFDEFSDGLLVIDGFHHIAYVNATMKSLYPNFGKKNQTSMLEELNELCEAGETLERKECFYEVCRKEIVKDGVSYGQMIVAKDVTQHRVYTARLEEQKNIAQKANQAKSDFLAKMSHEIRTPINAILGMNEMILRESEQMDITHYAMDIKTSANALLAIINDILDTSKIESGKLKILPVRYELDSLLNDVVNMAYVKAREKDLDFVLHADEHIPNGLIGDDVRIRQILVNILNNAVKYTETGSITLNVEVKWIRDEKDTMDSPMDEENCGKLLCLRFTVRDTGIGIKNEDLPKLTAAFERIEENRNREIEGTGLGMNIVVELLHRMDSELEVDSVYGEGSTFAFEICQPVWNMEMIGSFEERSERLHQHEKYAASFAAPEARILVVDDNATNRKVLRGLLKQNGIRIDEAESGYRCLECVQDEKYDIIIMDHMMPGMNGVETFHRLQSLNGNKSIDSPVIVLTANAVVGAKEKYLKEGFVDYLSKPIQVEKLEELILKYLPEEKIMQATEGFERKVCLPDLLEFDFDYARNHLQDDGILLETIRDVYQNLDSMKEKLEREYQLLQQYFFQEPDKNRSEEDFSDKRDGEVASGQLDDATEAISAYQIRVHSLKSDAAAIGALLLSNLARLLEVAAMEQDVNRIRKLHPILMEEIEKHKERMSVFDTEEKEEESLQQQRIDREEYREELEEEMAGETTDEEGEIWI